MAVLQTTYSERMPIGAPGMPADMTTWDGDTGIVESAGGIGFGLACSQGADPRGTLLGATAAALFKGISVRNLALPPERNDIYARYDNIALMFRGDIWVTVASVVVAGEPVTFNSTTGVLSTLGAGGSQFTIAGARWMTTQTTVGGLAICRLAGAQPTQNMAS